MTAPSDTSRERFLDLLVERLTLPATASGAEDAAALLEHVARLLETSGAYVIMLADDPHGEVVIESRDAWYEFDVPPLEITAERIALLEPIYRRGPLVIEDSRRLAPEADELRGALESRGLRSALMQPVYFDDVLRGFVGFNDARPRRWTTGELELATQLARLVVGTLDKRQADRSLAEAEARIRSFVAETPIPVYCWEFPQPIPVDLPVDEQVDAIRSGLLVECNEAYAAAYQLGSVEDAIGTRFGDVALLDTDQIRADLARFVKGGYRSVEKHSETRGGDGHSRIVVYNTTGFVDDGRLYRIWGNVRDVTAIMDAEREQDELEERMRAAQKLESLGLLAGGIAHDFNNLLFSIRGYAELARNDVAAGSPGEGFLDEIETAAGVASELCRQLLAYAGRGSFVLEPIAVNALIGDMRGLLESSVSGATALRIEFAEAPPIVADASQLQQILLNLVINAAEAIGSRPGSIVVSSGVAECTSDELAGPHGDLELPAGDYTFIEVSDDGSGMSADTEARLFDPFFTTKFTGRGLGMSAVLGIVRAHHGSIAVSTEEGSGTRVRVMFPAAGESAVARRPDGNNGPPAPLSGEAVLLVDDDDRVRAVGATMLERMGVTVFTADSGAEAVRVFADHADDISAVVLDLTMPEMDGVETFRRLRLRRNDVRVILTSGYTEQEATRHFVGRGLAAFLQKPYSATQLHLTLETVLAW